MILPAGTYPAGPLRPFTAMDNQGRRPPPGGRQQQPYPIVDEYPSPQGRQGPGQPGGFNGGPIPHISTPKPSQAHGNQGIKPPGTPIDIGFEAPAPRPKPAKSPAPSTVGGPNSRHSGGAGDKRPGSSLGPHSQQRPPNQQGPPNKAYGPPNKTHPSPPLGPAPGPPSPPVNPSQTPKPPPSSATPKPQSTPLPKPPGKGPKTFEEMGVPQQTKEADCVSIPQTWRHAPFLHPANRFLRMQIIM